MESIIIRLGEVYNVPTKNVNEVEFSVKKTNSDANYMIVKGKKGLVLSSEVGFGVGSQSSLVNRYEFGGDESINIYFQRNVITQIIINDITKVSEINTSTGVYTGVGEIYINLAEVSTIERLVIEGGSLPLSDIEDLKYFNNAKTLYITTIKGVPVFSENQYGILRELVLPSADLTLEQISKFLILDNVSIGSLTSNTNFTFACRLGGLRSRNTTNLSIVLKSLANGINNIQAGYTCNFGSVVEPITDDMKTDISVLKTKFTKVVINNINY